MKIHKFQIESFLVFISCLNISYLNAVIPSISLILFYVRIILIAFLTFKIIALRKKLSGSMKVLLFFVVWIVIVSVIRGAYVTGAIRGLSIPLLLAMYLDINRDKNYIYIIIEQWANVLLFLVSIDFITMIIFPQGMYKDNLYSLNWFLGYKTARLVFSLPLCIFQAVCSINKYDKLMPKVYLCFGLSIYTLFKAEATSGSVTMLIVCLIILVINYEKTDAHFNNFWKCFSNFKIIVPLYGIITFLTIYVQNSSVIQYFIVNVLKKDSTLTTRTTIWNNCIYVLRTHPITGLGYLSIDQYQNLTNNIYATSAHNMTLTILTSGGIIGIARYVFLIITAWNHSEGMKSIGAKIIGMGIVALLIIGMTSSSVLFSLCGFAFFVLMEVDTAQTEARYEE